MTPAAIVLAAITLQRLGELVLAQRNTRRLMAQGGRETGAGHYPMIVSLHIAWLATLWVLGWDRAVSLLWLGVFAALQLLRVWVIASLGGRWTTRIITLPGAPLVRRGPYRFLKHPNYVVVAAEVAAAPLALGLIGVAAVFTVLNALVLWVRIRAEGRALAPARAIEPRFQ